VSGVMKITPFCFLDFVRPLLHIMSVAIALYQIASSNSKNY